MSSFGFSFFLIVELCPLNKFYGFSPSPSIFLFLSTERSLCAMVLDPVYTEDKHFKRSEITLKKNAEYIWASSALAPVAATTLSTGVLFSRQQYRCQCRGPAGGDRGVLGTTILHFSRELVSLFWQ